MSAVTEHIHTDILFQLIGKHPHAGEYAHPVGASAETMTSETVCGEKMYLLSLVNCAHGMERCYAEKKNMRLVDKPPQHRQVKRTCRSNQQRR